MRPLCAYCEARPIPRGARRFCSLACRDAGVTKPRPACVQCGQPCRMRGHRYCSLTCAAAARKVVRRRCAAVGCTHRVRMKRARFCSKRCAWLSRQGWRQSHEKAAAARRQQYIARLRERLKGMKTAAEIWNAAYQAGYRAAYARYLRQLQRGEIVLTRERAITRREVA